MGKTHFTPQDGQILGVGLVLVDCVLVQPGTLDTRTRPRAATQEPQRGERQDSGEVELRRCLGPEVGRSGRARPTS
jgi:hypothetical protein